MKSVFRFTLLSCLAWTSASAQTLLRDFNTAPPAIVASSAPAEFWPLASGRLLFVATTPEVGRELWTTDGTAHGTSLLFDVQPGPVGSDASGFVELSQSPGVYLFAAKTVAAGMELWRTDGTASGTRLVRDVRSGTLGSGPTELTVTANGVAFLADDGVHGPELWWTDGSKQGTRMVRDIVPGGAGISAGAAEIAAVGGVGVVFTLVAGARAELWASDGTATGTQLVFDFGPSSALGPRRLVSIGSRVVFLARVGFGAETLWASDGRGAGTMSLGVDAMPDIQAVGATAFFRGPAALGGGSGFERDLWRTDGTAPGTSPVVDLVAGTDDPAFVGTLGGELFFFAIGPSGRQLYRTMGTASSTVAVTNNSVSMTLLSAEVGQEVQGILFFRAVFAGERGLYRTDGTAAGTSLVTSYATSELGVAGAATVLGANDLGGSIGFELYTTNGTPGGTQLLADLAPGAISESSTAFILGCFQDRTVLRVDDGLHGEEPWITDGTPGGTQLLADLSPGPAATTLVSVVAGDTRMLLLASVAGADREAWVSDGTAAGTYQLDVQPNGIGFHAKRAERLGSTGDRFVFTGSLAATGEELYVTDGTNAGTQLLADLHPGAAGSFPFGFVPFGELLVFRVAVGPSWLWATDGSPAGTIPLPAGAFQLPFFDWSPAVFGGRLWFVAQDAANGREVWSTDGTAAGTRLELDLVPGPGFSNPKSLVACGNQLMLRTEIGGQAQLVVSDGTSANTAVVPLPSAAFSGPFEATDSRVLLVLEQAGGKELWGSDGTVAGTSFLQTVQSSSLLADIGRLGQERVLLAMNNGVIGDELWASDGTVGGTFSVLDMVLGDAFPRGMSRAGSRVVYVADDGIHGRELFSIPLTQTRDWAVEVFGSGCPGTGGVTPTIGLDGTARASAQQPWSLTLSDAVPGSFAAFAWSSERAAVLLPGGCRLWLGPQPSLVVQPTNAIGRSGIAIAPSAVLLGARLTTQWFVLDANGAALGLLAATPALELVVGP